MKDLHHIDIKWMSESNIIHDSVLRLINALTKRIDCLCKEIDELFIKIYKLENQVFPV